MNPIDPVTAAGVASRAKVGELVLTDPETALAEARANPHGWYRCQSLTHVAANIQDDARAAAVLTEALNAARQQEEPNRIVSVSAWPVSVAVARSLLDVPAIVAELLEIIGREPNPIRRADALLLLLESVAKNREMRERVLAPLLEACASTQKRKSRLILQLTALAIGNHQSLARKVLDQMPECREKRQAIKRMKRREWVGPHEFVPYYRKP